ncbi:MAG: patatin-like phospholipase family protein [bacterium]|nr:patatin-like phospholipase family protein [bacterium]
MSLWSRIRSGVQKAVGRPRVSIALAGGGCKAFFALGVGHILLHAGLPLRRISGTSAGSAMAMCLLSDSAEESVRYFCAITRRNSANFHWSRLLRGRRPWPHERMYRSTIMSYTDIDRVRRSPIELAVNALRVPAAYQGAANHWQRYHLMGRIIAAYNREYRYSAQGIYRPVMRAIAAEVGLEEHIFTKADLNSDRRAADIVLAASSIWPLLRFQEMEDGELYLDGGITNNLPISSLPREDLVVAVHYDDRRMTRYFYEQSGDDVGRSIHYISPERPLPIEAFDYANADGVRTAYEMGLQSGRAHLPRIRGLLRNGF